MKIFRVSIVLIYKNSLFPISICAIIPSGGINMEIVLLIVSILLIIIVLLQSGKAESAGQIVQGGNSDLFANTKERGFELFLTRLTMLLGIAFFMISLVLSLKN